MSESTVSQNEKKRGWWPALVIFEAVTLGLGALNGFLTSKSMSIYDTLQQPPLAPPGWVFPVAWSILYAAMALSAFLIWREGSAEARGLLLLWGAQLLVNLAWPWIFFVLHAYGLAFLWLLVLWILVLLLMLSSFRRNHAAGWLLVPYLLWVTFAGYLNLMIAFLNP